MSVEPSTTELSSEPVTEPAALAAAPDEPTPASAPVTPEPVTPSWRDSLPVDLRDNPTLVGIDSVEGLAKDHINVQKLIGADKIARPQEDWTPEQWDDFHTKLGRPAKVEDYDLGGIQVPEGLPWNSEFQDSMVGVMHGLGLNQKQVQGVLGAYIESQAGQYQQVTGDATRSRDTAIQDLQNEWGKSYPAQVDLATRAFRAGAGENYEAVADLVMADGGLLGDHPDIIRAFAQLGGKMNEHGLVGATATRTTLSPGEAGDARRKLMSDEDFLKAYMDGGHFEHAAAVKRIKDLTIAEVGDDVKDSFISG